MAIIKLNNESFNAASDATLTGSTGNETVKVYEGVSVTTDSSIERVEFTRSTFDYTYKAVSGGVQVIYNGNVVANVAAGETLAFADGSMTCTGTFEGGTSKYFLGGAQVSTSGGALTNPTISTAPGQASTIALSTSTFLTVGQDNLVGTSQPDTFTARIVNNTNTFQSGDVINGGSGTEIDTLKATIGNSQDFAILAETNSVEKLVFQAQATASDSADNFNTNPEDTPLGDQLAPFSYLNASHDGASQVDAQLMAGVKEIWDDNSRANLVVEDVRVNSHETTIGFSNTDPGNVNYEVYFDPQHITGPGSAAKGASMTQRLTDVLDLGKGGNGLSKLPFSGFVLTVGTKDYTLNIDFSKLTSYDDYKAAVDKALTAAGLTTVKTSLSPKETAVFSITVVDGGTTYLQGTVGGTYNPLVFVNDGPEAITLKTYNTIPGSGDPSGNIVRTTTAGDPNSTPSLTEVNIILDNVARGDKSGSGDLVVGDMSESGIQKFNVKVVASSHIDQLASTNNFLEVVNVQNQDGAKGDLIINKLNDVRVFDAGKMLGAVTLSDVELSKWVTPKYLNSTDTSTDPTADNSEIAYNDVMSKEFYYNMGTVNDTVKMHISGSNWDTLGTTTREDFKLTINGNAGNDDLSLGIWGFGLVPNELRGAPADSADSAQKLPPLTTANWYENSALNANLTILGGAGNDKISTEYSSGNFIIDAGADNDVVKVDNSGFKAKWAFNAVGNPFSTLANLKSDTIETYSFYKSTLTVSYKGFEVTVDLPNSTGKVTDLQINNAIKAAILDQNKVLSKVLTAHDGPTGTLVVESLIDGNFNWNNLNISIKVPTSLSSADVTLLNTLYNTPSGTEATHLATFAASLASFNTNADYALNSNSFVGSFGSDSVFVVSDNKITLNTGDDTVVLGTSAFDNDTLIYKGYNNGYDSIFNYQLGHQVFVDPTPIVAVDCIGYTQGSNAVAASTIPGTKETFIAKFNVPTVAGNVVFDQGNDGFGVGTDLTIPVTVGMTAAQFAAAITSAAGSLWDAAADANGVITFTGKAVGDIGTTADFGVPNFQVITPVPNPTATGVIAAVTGNVDGTADVPVGTAAATTETFTLQFGNAIKDGNITFDGQSIPVLATETGANIAAAVATGNYANWTVVSFSGDQVTFAAKTTGNVADAVVDQNLLHVVSNGYAVDAFSVPLTDVNTTVTYSGVDYFDLSAYISGANKFDLANANFTTGFALANNTVTVLNNTPLGLDNIFTEADLATTTAEIHQVFFVEKYPGTTTNDGVYDVYEVSHTASTTATAVTVKLIATMDFGHELQHDVVMPLPFA